MTPLLLALLLAGPQLTDSSAPASAHMWWGDWNGDGLIDVVHARPGGGGRLLENSGGGVFVDVSASAGWPELADLRQVLFADLLGDGENELVLLHAEGLSLLARSDGALLDRTRLAGLGGAAGVTALGALDVDGDLKLELWLSAPGGDRVLRSTTGWPFEELDFGFAPEVSGPVVAVAEELEPGAEPPPPGEQLSPAAGRAQPRVPASGTSSVAGLGAEPVAAHTGEVVSGSSGTSQLAFCPSLVKDTLTGNCLQIFSLPVLGHLYPLTVNLNVDAAGYVGMGTTTPTHRLTVENTLSDDVLRLIGTGGFGEGARLNFGDGDYVHLAEVSDDKLEIAASAGTNFTGNVGIGNASPAWALDVEKSQAVGRFRTNASTNGSVIELGSSVANPAYMGAVNFVDDAGQTKGQIGYEGDNELTFKVNGSERLRVTPTGKLNARNSIANDYIAVLGNLDQVDGDGAFVFADAPSARAVTGFSFSTSFGVGVEGTTNASSGYGLFAQGNSGATGTKFFVQPHPDDPSKEVRFISLEGNESGTYFRGRSRTVGGRAVIDVPEAFRLVSEVEGLTVQLTPIGTLAVLCVESQDLESIVVRSNIDVEFSYFANGVRRGFAGHEPIRENFSYVPRERGVPYGTQYPEALRRILVENGTLNPDYTPNEATAGSLGWDLSASRRPGASSELAATDPAPAVIP